MKSVNRNEQVARGDKGSKVCDRSCCCERTTYSSLIVSKVWVITAGDIVLAHHAEASLITWSILAWIKVNKMRWHCRLWKVRSLNVLLKLDLEVF